MLKGGTSMMSSYSSTPMLHMSDGSEYLLRYRKKRDKSGSFKVIVNTQKYYRIKES
jgi:hypothetical protein